MLTALSIAGSLLLLRLSFGSVDLHAVVRIAGELQGNALALLVPSVMAVAVEAVSMQLAFGVMGYRTELLPLFRVRVASDSLGAILPGGALWSDAVKPMLFARHCRLPHAAGIAGIASRKYLLVLSQGAYLVLGYLLGRTAVDQGFVRLTGTPVFAGLVVVAGVVLMLLAESTALVLRGGATFERLLHTLGRVPSEWWRARLDGLRAEATRTDRAASAFFGASARVRVALAVPCLVGWLLEGTETWVILHAVGANVGWGDAIGIETVVALARHILFVLPGGLGAQEFGYATLLAGSGVDLGTAATFALLKRAKELVWVVTGYALLAGPTKNARPLATVTPEIVASL